MIAFCRAASLAVALLAAGGGCAREPRQAVEGTVTLDGAPLEQGVLTLLPLPGTPGPTAGGAIEQGRFAIPREQGVFAGKFRVEITALRKTGRPPVFDELTQRMVEIQEQYLPTRYNRESELTLDVREANAPPAAFALTSQ